MGLAVITILLLFLAYNSASKNIDTHRIKVGDARLIVEIANTPELRAQGLSGREVLEPYKGMLFIFESPEIQQFWMKDMRFPLDVLWIEGARVVSLTANIPEPIGQNIPQMNSIVPADKVIEVNAGFIHDNGIKIGDRFEFR